MEEQELIGSCFGVLKCCFFSGFLFCHSDILRVFSVEFLGYFDFVAMVTFPASTCAHAHQLLVFGDDSLDVLGSYFTPVPMGR